MRQPVFPPSVYGLTTYFTLDIMHLSEATDLIRKAIPDAPGVWADLGAGTGLFSEALLTLLPGGKVIALDKSPHALWRLRGNDRVQLQVEEGDFTRSLNLPQLDGILMANALHYAPDPANTLRHILTVLKPGGLFVLIEYDTDRPNPPWNPYPIPAKRWPEIAHIAGLDKPVFAGSIPSAFAEGVIYCSFARKTNVPATSS